MSEKHTPLPWKQVSREVHIGVDIKSENGRAIAATFGVCNQPKSKAGAEAQAEQDRANAALIVAAVNSYPSRQRLVSALEGCDEALQLAYKVPRPWIDGGVSYEEWEACCKKIDAAQAEARSALAETGEQP